MFDLFFPKTSKCLFCGRPDNYYEIIPFCPSCLEGFSFSGLGPGILFMEGILPDLLNKAEQGEEELIKPLAGLLALDCRLRGLRGKAVSPAGQDFLDKILARETAFFLNLPLLSSGPKTLVVGLSWSGFLKNDYPPDRVLALIR